MINDIVYVAVRSKRYDLDGNVKIGLGIFSKTKGSGK